MNSDWQSWAAPAIVALTVLWFVARSFSKGKKTGACGNCACDTKKLGSK